MLREGDQKLNTIKQNVFFFRNAYCNGLTISIRSPINQEDNVIKEISDRKSFDKRIVYVRCKCTRFIYLVLVKLINRLLIKKIHISVYTVTITKL